MAGPKSFLKRFIEKQPDLIGRRVFLCSKNKKGLECIVNANGSISVANGIDKEYFSANEIVLDYVSGKFQAAWFTIQQKASPPRLEFSTDLFLKSNRTGALRCALDLKAFDNRATVPSCEPLACRGFKISAPEISEIQNMNRTDITIMDDGMIHSVACSKIGQRNYFGCCKNCFSARNRIRSSIRYQKKSATPRVTYKSFLDNFLSKRPDFINHKAYLCTKSNSSMLVIIRKYGYVSPAYQPNKKYGSASDLIKDVISGQLVIPGFDVGRKTTALKLNFENDLFLYPKRSVPLRSLINQPATLPLPRDPSGRPVDAGCLGFKIGTVPLDLIKRLNIRGITISVNGIIKSQQCAVSRYGYICKKCNSLKKKINDRLWHLRKKYCHLNRDTDSSQQQQATTSATTNADQQAADGTSITGTPSSTAPKRSEVRDMSAEEYADIMQKLLDRLNRRGVLTTAVAANDITSIGGIDSNSAANTSDNGQAHSTSRNIDPGDVIIYSCSTESPCPGFERTPLERLLEDRRWTTERQQFSPVNIIGERLFSKKCQGVQPATSYLCDECKKTKSQLSSMLCKWSKRRVHNEQRFKHAPNRWLTSDEKMKKLTMLLKQRDAVISSMKRRMEAAEKLHQKELNKYRPRNFENRQAIRSVVSHLDKQSALIKSPMCPWKDGDTICGFNMDSTAALRAHVNEHHLNPQMSESVQVGTSHLEQRTYICKWEGCNRKKPFRMLAHIRRHMVFHVGSVETERQTVMLREQLLNLDRPITGRRYSNVTKSLLMEKYGYQGCDSMKNIRSRCPLPLPSRMKRNWPGNGEANAEQPEADELEEMPINGEMEIGSDDEDIEDVGEFDDEAEFGEAPDDDSSDVDD